MLNESRDERYERQQIEQQETELRELQEERFAEYGAFSVIKKESTSDEDKDSSDPR